MINKVNKILITGGAGYIGSHVAEKLVKTKCKIVIIDNLQRGSRKLINKKTNFIKADINNTKKLRQIILKKKIDTIIHLASFASVAESQKFKKKYYLNNVIGTQKLLQACKDTNIKNFIYSSSCSIYGNVKGKVSETKKPNPKSYYAFTKYKSENLIKNFYNFHPCCFS